MTENQQENPAGSSEELKALCRKLDDTREMSVLALKASISSLAALEELLKTMGRSDFRSSIQQREHLQIATDHVRRGLQVLQDAIEEKVIAEDDDRAR
ncbi:hypothetical protein J4558_27210 [Leptolyngbya sp. 15MV]|nr:hypothetical protein J4558_27210 [Leptolyngbya sp. 15MV]